MQIQFNYAHIDSSKPLEDHVTGELESNLGKYTQRLTRVEVHFADLNGSKKNGPADKRCMLEARPSGLDPIAIECFADTYYAAATDAAGKLGRALSHRLDR